MLIRKTFKYRLYPTKVQEETFLFILRRCRELYNSALEERQAAYRICGVSVGYAVQCHELLEIKEAFPAYQKIGAHVLQDALRRLDKAFQAFFRRVKNGEKPGYPRFKSKMRYHSFTFPDRERWKLVDNRLKLLGIGDVKVKLHRPIEGTIKTCTIKRDVDQWYVFFSCQVEAPAPLPPSNKEVGLDLGVIHFATLSTGEHIANPRPYRKGLKRLKLLQQAKDCKKHRSHRRKRAAIRLARAHRKVRNQRQDFQHKLARRLVNEYGLIVMEDLHIAQMVKAPEPKPDPEKEGAYLPNGAAAKGGLNQSILDAGWGQFQHFCVAKAEEAGRRIVFVDPYNTSQLCSGCGRLVPKDLEVRWHSCPYPDCGIELDRDHNSARTILFRGQEVAHRVTAL
ncbi:MAG TPA: RNA-guided endonuclease TnpB family protein [Ktedonobacterales bacterium]